MSEASEYYYSAVGGVKQGPVSSAELKQLARDGKLSGADLVWKEGFAEWVPASKIKGLVPADPPSVPKAGPPPVPAGGPPPVPHAAPPMPNPDGGRPAALAPAKLKEWATRLRGGPFVTQIESVWSKSGSTVKALSVVAAAAAGLLLVGACCALPLQWVFGNTTVSSEKLQAMYSKMNKGGAYKGNGPYDEKFINVVGKVSSTRYYGADNVLAKDKTHLELQTGTDHEVVCIFQGQQSGSVRLNRLSRGEQMTIRGKCVGLNLLGGVVLEDCEVVSGPK